MLIAYLDEFGHIGPYIEDGHPRFGQHPIFGYSGFIVPVQHARALGAEFKRVKTALFKTEIEQSPVPAQWERKGSEYFSTGSISKRPEQLRAFRGLMRRLHSLGGSLFYYGDEKARGTLKQTGRDSNTITLDALRETINRLCRYADNADDDLLILMDAITDKSRRELVAKLYAHIYSRPRPEMKRIVEAPLHIESELNSGIQLADWICALLTRASHFQMVKDSTFAWAPEHFRDSMQGMFTYESKLHLWSGPPLHHSEVFKTKPHHSHPLGANSIGDRVTNMRAVYEAAMRQRQLGAT
ncbi:DUF3800 domain-containing protein [Promicromonospora sukumoe]